MSWLLGNWGNKSFPAGPGGQPPLGGGSGGIDGGENKDDSSSSQQTTFSVQETKEGRKWVGFDPTGLERAAKAARELDKSTNAQGALEIAKMQERTENLKHQEKIKEYELSLQQMDIERTRVQHEERRKTLEEETKQHTQRAQYQDQLARRRYDDQVAQQRRMQEENLRRQEESVKKQEAMRKATIEYEAELRHKNEMKRLEAKLHEKARIERENHDIRMEQLKLQAAEDRLTAVKKAAEYRITVLKSIGAIGQGITNFITDWEKVSAMVATLTLVAAGVYSAKIGTGIAGRFIEAHLGKPSLIRETSRLSFLQTLRHPLQAFGRLFTKPKDALQGIIFEPQFERRLRSLARATVNTKRNGGVYRNVLMHGPPGTGKTMFAKRLARLSGMDYAIMTGGDVVPLGKEGVTAIHKVFEWANASRKGVLLFVDEADALFGQRSKVVMNRDLRSTLNAFLYCTGESSSKFMVILASNLPDQFDWAINDRLDDLITFSIPGEAERLRMLKQYFAQYVLSPPRTSWWRPQKMIPLPLDIDWDQKFLSIAKELEGFSGREVAKLTIAWQAAAYGSAEGKLTVEMIDECVRQMVSQHKLKAIWQKDLKTH